MIIRVEIRCPKPRLVRSLTGMTVEEFEALFARWLSVWEQPEQERLSRPDRQRAIGGGRKYPLSIPNMPLTTLISLRQYWNTEALAFLLSVDRATVSQNTRRMLKAGPAIGIESLGWPRPPRKLAKRRGEERPRGGIGGLPRWAGPPLAPQIEDSSPPHRLETL